jgi:hypothetical protein
MYRTAIPSWSTLLRQGAPSRSRFWRVAVSPVVVLVGAGLLLPIPARAQEAKHIHTTNGTVDFDTKTIARAGYSVLIRTEDDVSLRLHETDLNAGHAYTFWMLVTDPDGSQYGGRVDGRVVDASGIVNLKVEIEVGETVGDTHVEYLAPLVEGKLRNPMTSTLVMVIRDHGPASSDPVDLFAQLHTFQDNPSVANYAITIHAP